MRLVQVISDFIRRSVLTTQGDLVVRGATRPERLAAGILNRVLTAQGAGAIPVWQVAGGGGGAMEMGNFSRSTAGSTVVTGCGFRPAWVAFFAVTPVANEKNFSVGFDYLTKAMCLRNFDGVSHISAHDDRSVTIRRISNNYIMGHITAFSGDGFTITFTKLGTATANVYWFAHE